MNECTYVTGSGKRYIVVHTMIFLYKRCSKNRNIYKKKKKIVLLGYLQLFAYTHAKTERPSNWSSALLKDNYLNLLYSKNVVKWGWAERKIRL